MIYRFKDFLKIIKGNFVCATEGQLIAGKDIDINIYGDYGVVSVEINDGIILSKLKPFESQMPEYDANEAWVKEHKRQFGTEPDFF